MSANLAKLHEYRQTVFIGLTLVGALLIISMFAMGRPGFVGFSVSGILLVSLLGIRDVLWHASQPDERQQQLREVAKEINFSFTEQTDHNPFGLAKSFLLTQKGVQTAEAIDGMWITAWLAFALPKFRNLFQRTMDDFTVSVFDYEFSESDESPTIRQTVFVVASIDLHRPHVALCPATTWDKVASKVSSSVLLARGYRLTSENEEVGIELADQLTELLDGATCIEFGEGHLLLYRKGLLVPPYQIEGLIKEGLLAYTQVADAIAKSQREGVLVN